MRNVLENLVTAAKSVKQPGPKLKKAIAAAENRLHEVDSREELKKLALALKDENPQGSSPSRRILTLITDMRLPFTLRTGSCASWPSCLAALKRNSPERTITSLRLATTGTAEARSICGPSQTR